jgi:nucleotide-binding universal stress UspA family protein
MVASTKQPTRDVALGVLPTYVVANPIRRGPVVLATDGTSETGAPVVAAQLLAARLDLPLEVVSVLEPLPTFSFAPDVVVALDPAIDESRRDERETSVRDYVGRFAGGAAPPPINTRFGHVATEIARFARETSATIIVMGSAPHQRFRHVVSGERAAQVLHSSPCPILSVPPTFTALPRSVVAAVDFGPSSARAVQAALLVVGEGGTVTLTHVMPPPVRVSWLRIVPDEELAVNMHALFDLLREEIGSAIPDGVTVETRLVPGDTVDGILSSATQLDADLIAVGTHGPGLVARVFIGSVAANVLRVAEQAVLASPPPPANEARTARHHASDVASTDHAHAWALALDAFSERNAGRAVMLEVEDPAIGAQVTGRGYTFLGATYEPAAERVEIMVGDSSHPEQHLTRSVLRPDAVTVTPAETGDGEVLDIRHGRGHTIATVTDLIAPKA